MKTIINRIKNGPILPAYLFYGEERYLIFQYKHMLLQRLGIEKDDMNFTKYTAESFDLNECLDTARTLPFFADRRVILIQDANLFTSKNDDLRDYLSSPEETACLIFIEEKIKANLGTVKAIGGFDGLFDCSTPTQKQLESWILQRIDRAGKRIRRDAFGELWLRTDGNMAHISCELEKLLAYCSDKQDIDLNDVRTICSGSAEITIFDMTDAISVKDPETAFTLCDELFEEKQTPVGILLMISRAFFQLLEIKEYSADRLSDREISQRMHVPPFIIQKKLRPMAANFSEAELKDLLKTAASLDEQIKSGRINGKLAVSQLIYRGTSSS